MGTEVSRHAESNPQIACFVLYPSSTIKTEFAVWTEWLGTQLLIFCCYYKLRPFLLPEFFFRLHGLHRRSLVST